MKQKSFKMDCRKNQSNHSKKSDVKMTVVIKKCSLLLFSIRMSLSHSLYSLKPFTSFRDFFFLSIHTHRIWLLWLFECAENGSDYISFDSFSLFSRVKMYAKKKAGTELSVNAFRGYWYVCGTEKNGRAELACHFSVSRITQTPCQASKGLKASSETLSVLRMHTIDEADLSWVQSVEQRLRKANKLWAKIFQAFLLP